MDMKHVEAGTSGNKEMKKRGRKPKTNPQIHRLMIRLNDADRERFLAMYRRSGKRSYSAFIADCVLNKPLKIIEINKSAIDFTMLLSSFFAQFRVIGNNYNQVNRFIYSRYDKETAKEMMSGVVKATIDFIIVAKKMEEQINRFREICLPK